MKKRHYVVAVCAIVVAILLVVIPAPEVGRDVPPDLGYHPAEETDVFETGRLDGEFAQGPVSEAFQAFEDDSRSSLARFRQASPYTDRGLGLIPSPVPEDVYEPSRSKSSDARVYDDVYDLRDPDRDGDRSDSLIPPAREQGACGACWAFAAYGCLEGVSRTLLGHEADYAENHVLFESGYDWTGCAGGNVDMVMAYLARHGGPLDEQDSPFTRNPSPSCGDCPPVRYIDSVFRLPVRSSITDIVYIKKALLDHGPLYASINWDDDAYQENDHTYYHEIRGSNHAVTIVGWDDERTVRGVDAPGVFIVRNSWGTDWGEGGFFYVSYADRSLAFSSLVAVRDRPDALLSFDRIYAHDPLGMTSSTGDGDHDAWGASVFRAVEDGVLTAVSFFTTSQDTHYEIRIHAGMDGDRMGPVLFGPVLGTARGKGYHTVPMDELTFLGRGEPFAVSVKFETPSGIWPVPLEKPFADYSSAADANPGETYLSRDGIRWVDTIRTFPHAGVCIKALVRERPCRQDLLTVAGPGDPTDFIVQNREGALAMAVVTDDCGRPVYDAEVMAVLNNGASESVLYDDGLHHDGLTDDGVYARSLEDVGSRPISSVMVRAVKEGRETFTEGEVRRDEPNGGSGGGGCFVLAARFGD
ncbi:hypothetical protein JCM14469_06320 [Desulfatiferula olefinivorans]